MTERARLTLIVCLFSLSGLILLPFLLLVSYRVTNLAMHPTIPKDAHIVFWRFGEQRFVRGVMACYHRTNNEQERILDIKRIVGLPGETVIITDGKASILGDSWRDTYGHFDDRPDYLPPELLLPRRITLGPDEVFVLGDNRWRSWDSRMHGPVKITEFAYWDPVYIHR